MENLDEGMNLFNEGKHQEAHEAWEHIWVNLQESPSKRFFQGMIMAAAAMDKYKKKEHVGTEKMLTKSFRCINAFIDADVQIDRQDFLKSFLSFKEKFDASINIPESEFPEIKKQ